MRPSETVRLMEAVLPVLYTLIIVLSVVSSKYYWQHY